MHKPLKRLWFHPHLFIYFIFFFLYQGFISQTLAIHRTAGEVRRPPFITLYHFQPLTNIQAFVCNLHMNDYHVFLITTFVFTRLLLKEIFHLIELPFDWLIDGTMFVCLLDDLILIKNIINRITCWFSAWSWTAQNCRDSVLEILLHFIKYRNTQLISWCIDFVETRNFRRVSDESAKALQRFTQPEI